MTEPHYRGPWIISLRQPQQLLLDCQGSDRHPTVCPSTQTLSMLLKKHGKANVLKKDLLFPLRDCCWSGLSHETLLLAGMAGLIERSQRLEEMCNLAKDTRRSRNVSSLPLETPKSNIQRNIYRES